jgi:uncharacterized protein (DUF305 family)
MNANELADCIEFDAPIVGINKEAATMLRQQQAEIEALKKAPTKYCPSENNAAYEKGFIDGMAKMTESAVHRAVEGMSEKTLTDEEILDEYRQCYGDEGTLTDCYFARQILLRAQEK